jgi:hypothetical protein
MRDSFPSADKEKLLCSGRHRFLHGHRVCDGDIDESSVSPFFFRPPRNASWPRLNVYSAMFLRRGHQLGSSADPDDVYIKAFVYSWLGGMSIGACHHCHDLALMTGNLHTVYSDSIRRYLHHCSHLVCTS